MDPPHTLIIGAGIFGLSTAFHLALRDPRHASRITILDRAPAPSAPAASTDLNKIVRADYSSPLYMELGFGAISAWKEPPFRDFYHQTGWVMMDEEDSDLAERVRANFRACGREEGIADLTEDEVRSKWGGLLNDTDYTGFGRYYFNATAGWADAGAAVARLAEEVVKMGVRYRVAEVEGIIPGDGGVQGVQLKNGQVCSADRVLLCTGAWTSAVMSFVEDVLDLDPEDRIENQVTAAGVCVAHVQLTDEEREKYSQLPVYVYGANGMIPPSCSPVYYHLTRPGEVIPPTASGILKFTNATSFKNTVVTQTGHLISVPPLDSQLAVPRCLQEEALQQLRARLPRVVDNGRQVDYFRLCWDSVSPNQQPLITRHPDARLGNLYLAVGGSFHCWKFLPVIGRYVANVLDGASNGPEKDQAWQWKRTAQTARGVHEKVMPQRDL
ncbi:FAD dependent oxidoreductase [Aspergillus sp. HF37]|nr:FAD dependent oxidoreductase [Aspergillus sp. HF37]